MTPGNKPPLSVVVATTKPWPAIHGCLEALYDQAWAVGAEIIVADGSGQVLPAEPAARYPAICWLRAPGGSVFQLRGLAVAHARADVVAMTEDHAWPRPGWCTGILRAHAAYPAAAAIGGVVENGSTESLADWANFLIANAPFMRPIACGESRWISTQANVSYKRWAWPTPVPAVGVMEWLYNQALRRRGEMLVADDRLVVDHVQARGLLEHSAVHFHNGRSIAGFRLADVGLAERVARLLGCFVLPPVMLWRTLGTVFRKRRVVGCALRSVPWMVWLLCCHAAGEFAGYLRGPGQSPCRLD